MGQLIILIFTASQSVFGIQNTEYRIQSGGPRPPVVYGIDNRQDLYNVQSPMLKTLANSVAILLDKSRVTPVDADHFQLAAASYAEEYSLCPSESFFSQFIGGDCTAFLVAPTLLATAGHCTNIYSCDDTRFYFAFEHAVVGDDPRLGKNEDLYSCKRIVHSIVEDSGVDFGIIELDRPVTNRNPLVLREQDTAAVGEELVVIGHPSGLPKKVATGGIVRDSLLTSHLVVSLDTYGGNSGSPVFNLQSGVVEGILVRGEEDYRFEGNCRVSFTCAQDACRGEDVSKVSHLLSFIPH